MVKKVNRNLRHLSLAASIALSLGLVGCGGSSDSGGIEDKTITGVELSGVASKGIVKAGLVTVEELNAQGSVIATVGTATTAADGRYSLILDTNYAGGPIQVTVTTDDNSQMKCDAPAGCGTRLVRDDIQDSNSLIDFGEWYKPNALSMEALVGSAKSNEKHNANITPFTHMAAARAKAESIFKSSDLNAAAVQNANSEVSNLLGGIDILNTTPIDITDPTIVNGTELSQTQLIYASLSSALANQGLTDENGQPDLNKAITLLATSFEQGAMQADNSTGSGGTQITLQNIVTATKATLAQAGVSDVTGVLSGLQETIDTAVATTGGVIDPEPSDTANFPDMAKVKAMVSDVRTWGNVIKAEAQTPGAAFELQVNMASDAVNALSVNSANAFGAAVTAVFEFDSTQTDLANAYYNNVLLADAFSSGTITSLSPGVVTITDGVMNGFTVNLTINRPENNTTASRFQFEIVSADIVGNDNTLTINSGVVDITLSNTYTIDYAAINSVAGDVIPDPTGLTFDLNDISFTQKVDSTGIVLASPVTFTGAMSFDLAVVTVINDPADTTDDEIGALPREFNLTGVISNTLGDSFSASLVVNVLNTATFQFVGDAAPIGTLYSSLHPASSPFSWAYSDTDSDAVLDTFIYIQPYGPEKMYWSAVDASITNTYTYPAWNNETSISDVVSLRYGTNSSYENRYYVAGVGEYAFDDTSADYSQDGFVDGVLVTDYDTSPGPVVGDLYSADNLAPVYFWKYTNEDTAPGNDTFTIQRPSSGAFPKKLYFDAANTSISSSYTYASTVAGIVEYVTNIKSSGGYGNYYNVSGEGGYFFDDSATDYSVDGRLDGRLINPEFVVESNTDNGWIDAKLGLTFVAQLNGLPEARININAGRTGFDAGSADMTVSYGSNQLAFSSSVSAGQVNAITVTNQDNVVLTIDALAKDTIPAPLLTGRLTYNGKEYATLGETSNDLFKISYKDGTFEIF